MKLSEMLSPDAIRIPLRSDQKEDVLRELVALLPSAADEAIRDKVHEAVLEREKRMSTGIGQGIAIPHGKCGDVDHMEIAFGLAPRPIEFDALDGAPVGIFFLLVSPSGRAGRRAPSYSGAQRSCRSYLR